MSSKNKPIVLVDGSSYLYRAFHALPALMNSKGFPTGAIYGVINMLKKELNDYQPDCMAIVFDSKGKTFRDEMYKEYKATRKIMPDDLSLQIPIVFEIIEAMGLPIIMIDGVEADDIIGTFAEKTKKRDIELLVSTSDKDLAQLVTKKVTLVNTMSNTVLDPKGVEEKFGIPPELMIDYLTLVGDTSDNIPGVPMVGPKTAVKWLKQFGSLDKIVAHADEMPGKVGENLRASLGHLPLTKALVTIKKDVKLNFDFDDLRIQPADKQKLIHLYRDMEFRSWLAELLKETQEDNKEVYAQYKLVNTGAEFEKYLKELTKAKLVSIVFKTNLDDYMQAEIVGIATATAPGKAVYMPVSGSDTKLTKEYALNKLKPFLEDKKFKKIGQNNKFIIEVLERENIFAQGFDYDSMLESYILDTTSSTHLLDDLALKYLGWRSTSYEDIAGKGVKQVTFNHVELEKAKLFAAEEADLIFRLHELFWQRIMTEEKLQSVFATIEMPLVVVLARMERAGVLIDPVKLKKHGKELQTRLDELEKQAYKIAGEVFNMNSPKQLQEILFTKLKLPVLQKTPTGQASTADNVLQELALEFELPRIIIEHRSLSKLISTYTSRLAEQLNPKTHRIHTVYNQAATATGRLSSSDPNLQNIPIRTLEGRRIRQAFIADKGFKILRADYSQIELRLMAHLSQDPNLLHAFAENLDIHRATAAEVWEVPLDKVTQEMRRNAKAINFGLIYGMSAFGLTRQLGIERKAAQEYIDRYFSRYPKVKAYMENTRIRAKEMGYVETLWGRRLYIPDIRASQIMRQRAAERMAINAPLQGSAADIIKLAMIKIDTWLQAKKLATRMIMQVHDELVFEVPEAELTLVTEEIRKLMSQVVVIDVPLIVSIGVGENWDDASKD